jgi:hypothetical protein
MAKISDKQLTHVEAQDWMTLARIPSSTERGSLIQNIFYPTIKNHSINSHDGQQYYPRAPGFLIALTDDQYDRAYHYILETEQKDLVDIHTLLKSVKRESRVISSVMSHVVLWVNSNPAVPKARDNNKPSHRMDFLPLLREHNAELADEVSIKLERDIILFIQSRHAELTSFDCDPYLGEYPHDNDTSYAKRFCHRVWLDLLRLVRNTAGANLPCLAISQLNSYNVSGGDEALEPLCAITQSMCSVIPRIPDILKNPALRHETAVKELRNEIMTLIAPA